MRSTYEQDIAGLSFLDGPRGEVTVHLGPHEYPPASPNPETLHPCAFPADLPEQVPNNE